MLFYVEFGFNEREFILCLMPDFRNYGGVNGGHYKGKLVGHSEHFPQYYLRRTGRLPLFSVRIEEDSVP
jgi:hypothetical protein